MHGRLYARNFRQKARRQHNNLHDDGHCPIHADLMTNNELRCEYVFHELSSYGMLYNVITPITLLMGVTIGCNVNIGASPATYLRIQRYLALLNRLC